MIENNKITKFNQEISDLKQSKLLVCGGCDKYIDCKDLLQKDAPACKIYRTKN